MARKVSIVLLVSIAAVTALGGCRSGTIYKKGTLGHLDTLSIDARQRLAFTGEYSDENGLVQPALCVEPSPDAAVAVAAAFAAGGNASAPAAAGTSAGAISAALSASSSEAVASIGLRTQTIQLLRDGYYRACEGLLNGVIDEGDYKQILANIDSTMIALAAVDALSVAGTTQAPAVAITADGVTASAAPAGTTISAGTDAAGNPVAIQSAFPAGHQMIPEQAKAIESIALTALEHARRRGYGNVDPGPPVTVFRK